MPSEQTLTALARVLKVPGRQAAGEHVDDDGQIQESPADDGQIYSDAHYRTVLADTWVRRMEAWVTLPDTLPDAVRARLTAARLLADGYWTAAATVVFPVPDHDHAPPGRSQEPPERRDPLMKKWLLLTAAILLEVTAALPLRGALEHPALYVVVAIGYSASFVALSLVLRAAWLSVSPTVSGSPAASP
ncbi:hypothetical protein [Streptomyces sp. NPDC014676]|uniref:hypothetical protein n=1 Tax=Streptomyces sp. NPDC014676 TaxID=3364879 RepID=UPI003702545F